MISNLWRKFIQDSPYYYWSMLSGPTRQITSGASDYHPYYSTDRHDAFHDDVFPKIQNLAFWSHLDYFSV